MRRRQPHQPPRAPIESGVTVYGSGNLTDIEYDPENNVDDLALQDIIEGVIAVHNRNHPTRRIFGPRDDGNQKQGLKEHALQPGIHPHEPVRHLAKAALRYSNGFVASVDTSKSMISWQATEQA